MIDSSQEIITFYLRIPLEEAYDQENTHTAIEIGNVIDNIQCVAFMAEEKRIA